MACSSLDSVRDHSRNIVLHFYSGLHFQPPSSAFPLALVEGSLCMLCKGTGKGSRPSLLTEAELLSALCVYLEKSKHPLRVYKCLLLTRNSREL